MSSKRRKTRKGSKCHKKWQIKQNGKKELRKAQKYKNSQNSKLSLKEAPSNTFNVSSPL
jgi:hypothetical protein